MSSNLSVNNFIEKHPFVCVFTCGLAIVGFLGYKAVVWIREKYEKHEEINRIRKEALEQIQKDSKAKQEEDLTLSSQNSLPDKIITKNSASISLEISNPNLNVLETVDTTPLQDKTDAVADHLLKRHYLVDSSFPDQARVYFLGETHETTDTEENAEFIRENYDKERGDLVLLEGFSGEPSEDLKETLRKKYGLSSDTVIYGWDNINQKSQVFLALVFKLQPKFSKLLKLIKDFKEDTEPAEKAKIIQELNELISSLLKLKPLIDPLINTSKLEIVNSDLQKDQTISNQMKINICDFLSLNCLIINGTLNSIIAGQSFVERNTSLVEVIKSKFGGEKRIFVIGGRDHFYAASASTENKVQEGVNILNEALKTNQIAYVTLFPKKPSAFIQSKDSLDLSKSAVSVAKKSRKNKKSLPETLFLLDQTAKEASEYKTQLLNPPGIINRIYQKIFK